MTQKSQVPELKELNLVEGMRQLQNEGEYQEDNHIKVLSNMMEEETHVVDNMSDHEGICQVLFEAIEDQSEVCGRAIEAISGLSQSNQCRLGKSDGKPNTPLPATKSVGQKQKVGLGNLSLNSPDVVIGDLFHDLYCGSKCVSMDETGIWSILTDTLHYVKPEVDSSVTYSYDQRRHQNANLRYFDAAFSNVPNEENVLIDQTVNSKKENFDAANYNVPNVPIYTQALFPKYEEDRYGNLTLFTTSVFKPHESICATYLWTEENQCSIMESEAYDMEGNDMWFKQGKFPINLHSETQGELMDGTNIKVTTLMDTGCSKPILNKKFYDKHPYLQEMPHYPIQSIGVIVADDGVIKVTEAIQFMIRFHGHVFEFIAYLADMSETFDFVIGQKSMYELEATVDYNNLAFTFLKRSLPVYAVDNFTVKPGKTKDVALELKDVPFKVHGYTDFPKDGVAVVAKLKSAKDNQLVQTLILHLFEDGKTTVQLTNHSKENWKIKQGDLMGCFDMRSSGYFHVSRDTLQQIMQSSFKDNCSFLNETETSEYFKLYHQDHEEVISYASSQVNQRLKQQQGNSKLVDRKEDDENDTNIVPDKEKDPYPWLEDDDPRRHMSDQEILEKYVDLSDSDLSHAEKKSLYKILLKYKEAFSLRDEIGLCPNMEIELELNDETPFFIRPFPIKENEKDVVDKEMRKGCLLGILRKGMSSYSSPIMLIPRKLTGIPRIVTDFRHLNSRLVTLQPSIPLVRDAIQILGSSGSEVLSLADLRDAYHTLRLSKRSQKFCGITPYYGSDSYLYQRLGMGLSVSPAIWQNFIQRVLQEIPDYRKNYLAIMDDILTHSNREDHTGYLIDLFKAIIRNGLKISPRKCKLFKTELVFMGVIIKIEDGMPKMQPLKSRIEAIQKVKPPKTVKECRSFCGMVNYMSVFLPSLQEKLIPIYFITRKGIPFYWGEEQQKAFDEIKYDVTHAPVLLMPNSKGHFVLVSDTSKVGCGAALYQKQRGRYHLVAYYSKRLPEAVANYSISELELTGVMANVAAFKHLLRNANFHVYCDHSALVHILKAKREPPTLRLKKLIENLSEYKFDIYFLKGKEMHISDFLSRHPDDEDSPNEIIPIAFMLQELETDKFPDHLLYLKEEVDALPEQDNYIPYHENDFMFLFSDDNHDNVSLISELYCAESMRIEGLKVCREEKRQLHDILNVMTRSMSKSQKADVPAIYPLKGEHKKPEHVKPPPVVEPIVEEIAEQGGPVGQIDSEIAELPAIQEMPLQAVPTKVHDQPFSGYPMNRQEVYTSRMKRPNPLLEPSSYPQVMGKQLPKYEGLLTPQPIEIELRGRLPSYDVDKAIEKYPFTMDIPSIEELKEKKRKLFKKIPEDAVFRKHIPKQVELDRFIDALKEKVIHDYNIPIHVKALRAEYKRSPYFRDIVKYIKTGYCSYVGKAQRLFKMLCEDYILMDDILFKIRYVKEQKGKPTLVLCVPEKYIPIILYQYHAPLLAGHPGIVTMYHMVRKKYYFPTMMPLIKQFVASCYECQSMKENQPIPKVHYPRIPLDTRLMARVSMDIKEMPKSILGYNCILVCVCEYTNWIKAIPLVDQKAGTIADAIFFRIICEYGTPKAIICDEGPAFTSDLMKMYFHAMNIKPYYISPMNHGSNRAERYIRTLNDIICRNLTGIGEKWPLFVLPSCWAMNTQVSQVTGFSPYEMVYHSEPPDLFNFNYKPEQTGINVSTKQYLEQMFKKKVLMDQLIVERKSYEKNTQWIRELRKYPDHETFSVGDLVMVYHPLGSVLQSPSRKLNRNWIGPLRVQTVLDNTHYLCSDWSGKLIPKRFHINRLKQYYMNLGELGEDGQLKIVQNVNELYEKWNELKEDGMITDSAQENVNNGKIT